MTTQDFIKFILNLFKFTPRHQATFAITSLIVFLIPKNLIKDIIPTALNDYYRPIAALIFILSISGLAVEFIVFLSRQIRLYFSIHKGKTRLNSLTKEEKNILIKYIGGESRTHYFNTQNGAVAELETLGILVTYTDTGHVINGFAFGISEWALKYLKCKRHLLETSNEKKR
jgi:hypothetical protein